MRGDKLSANNRPYFKMTLTEVLLKKNIVNSALLAQSRQEAAGKGISLEEVLIAKGVSDDDITQAKEEVFNIPIKKITDSTRVPMEFLREIPQDSVRHYKFMPLEYNDGILDVGVVNPDDAETRDALQFLSSKLSIPLKIFLVSYTDFNKLLKEYGSLGGQAVEVLGEFESMLGKKTSLPKDIGAEESKLVSMSEDAPIIKMLTVIMRHAIEGRASDIHIEPLRNELKVRFRVDGILHTSLKLPSNVHEALVARIKILTNMKLDERRKPQDGRFEAKIDNRHVDFRVSTFPTFFGEKVVIRILDTSTTIEEKLEDTGMNGRNLLEVQEALKKPYGMILLTGPTGSGKTTTLYRMLKQLDKEKLNVVSLEDPIEYNLEGVSQSQVRPELDYDFANGLRSILRQDPDVIMVGEMRDKETAKLAVQAALTGHLVFSTLHTNNAVGVIPRLIDMGVDPYLIPSVLILAIAQRLVRTLCPESRKTVDVDGAMKEILEAETKDMPTQLKEKIKIPKQIYKALSSATCPRGTKGRTAVFEVLKMTPQLESMILTGISESAIMEEARRQGMITMREDGVLKVFDGIFGMEQLREVL